MRKYLLLICLAFAGNVYAQFPTNSQTFVLNIDHMSEGFNDFRGVWRRFEDQSVTFTITNDNGYVDLTGYYVLVKGSRRVPGDTNQVGFALNAGDVTISGSNATFSLTGAEVPDNGLYDTEVLLSLAATTNTIRCLGRGAMRVVDSLFDDADGTWAGHGFTNLVDYLTIASAAGTYMAIADYDTNDNNIVDTSDAFIAYTNSGVGANSVTGVVGNAECVLSVTGRVVYGTIGSGIARDTEVTAATATLHSVISSEIDNDVAAGTTTVYSAARNIPNLTNAPGYSGGYFRRAADGTVEAGSVLETNSTIYLGYNLAADSYWPGVRYSTSAGTMALAFDEYDDGAGPPPVGAAAYSGFVLGDMYFGIADAPVADMRYNTNGIWMAYNSINSGYGGGTDGLWINKAGANGGTGQFRDFYMGDGKGNALWWVDGSEGTTYYTNSIVLVRYPVETNEPITHTYLEHSMTNYMVTNAVRNMPYDLHYFRDRPQVGNTEDGQGIVVWRDAPEGKDWGVMQINQYRALSFFSSAQIYFESSGNIVFWTPSGNYNCIFDSSGKALFRHQGNGDAVTFAIDHDEQTVYSGRAGTIISNLVLGASIYSDGEHIGFGTNAPGCEVHVGGTAAPAAATGDGDMFAASDAEVREKIYLGDTNNTFGYFQVGTTNLQWVAMYTNGVAISPAVTNDIISNMGN